MKNKLQKIFSNFKTKQADTIELTANKLSIFYAWQTHVCIVFMLLLSYFYVDRPLATFFYERRDILSFLKVVGWFHGVIVIFLLICLTLIARYKHHEFWQRCFGFTTLWLTITYFFCSIAKVLLGRARPEEWILHHIFGFFGPGHYDRMFQSFPSGHTTTWFAMMLGFSLFFPAYLGRLVFIALGFSFVRVLLAQHFLSDVLGTAYLIFLGWLYLVTATHSITKKHNPLSRKLTKDEAKIGKNI